MPKGKVKWFDPKKGYGFIIGDEGQDVFVHYTSIVGDGFRALRDGETVDYELTRGDKGFQARNVLQPGSPAADRSEPPPAGNA
jgi:CspA family cold shock protein